MASDSVTVQLEGIDELKRALADVSKQIRTKAVRGALRQAGNIIKKQAQSNAPILKSPAPNRKPGTIRRSITVRASKFARRNKDEGVYISVRPLRGSRQKRLGKAGANNPNDPFYWRFLEFGTKAYVIKPTKGRRFLKFGVRFAKSVKHPGIAAQRFMTRAAEQRGKEAIAVFMREVIPQIEKFNAREQRVR